MPAKEIDGTDVEIVWQTANEFISRARSGEGPSFLLAKCKHLHGHFLGDPLLRIVNKPVKELGKIAPGLLKSTARIKGASLRERVESIKDVLSLLTRTAKYKYTEKDDPLSLLRKKLGDKTKDAEAIEQDVNHEMEVVVKEVLENYLESNQL
jgi:TPP-dependent pyruvate/acetoin dehydrogenase alpha subunit